MSVALSEIIRNSGSFRTLKSGVLLENIDRVEIDRLGRLRIRGYVRTLPWSEPRSERWTILDPHDVDLFS